MDKIEKYLRKLSVAERARVAKALELLFVGDIEGLDIKRLTARGHMYRVRVGDIRIIVRIDARGIFVFAIERRGDNTYKKLR